MSMPIIPGLAGAAPAEDDEGGAPGGGVADALAMLSDEDLAGLEQAAQAAAEAGELAGVLGDAEQVGDAAEEHDEQHETPEEEMSETDEQQAEEEDEGEEDPTPHVRAAEDAAKASATALAELEKLVEDAGEHEKAGLDMEDVEGLLKEAQEANDEASDANDDAHGADAEEAAKLAQTAQEAAETVASNLAQAKEKLAAAVKAATDDAVPDGVRAMTQWAKGTLGVA